MPEIVSPEARAEAAAKRAAFMAFQDGERQDPKSVRQERSTPMPKTATRRVVSPEAARQRTQRAALAARLNAAKRQDPKMVHQAVQVAAQRAEARLRRALAGMDAGEVGDHGTAIAEALEELEGAENRAARLGIDRNPYAQGSGASFFRDLLHADQGNSAAKTRLGEFQSASEARSALGVTSSFVAPAYDVAAYADVPRQEQVFAALATRRPLPKGSSVSIPQFSASASVAPTAQNTAPGETDIADAFLQRPVGWLAGMLTVSQQVWDQAWDPTFDEAAAEVLTDAYDEDLESQCFIGSGSSAQLLGVMNGSNVVPITYTSSAPAQTGLLSVVGQGVSQFARRRKKLPTAIFMTPLRWAWLASGQDSQTRPLLVPTGPPSAIAVRGTDPAGTIDGIPVYVTSGIPSNGGGGANQDTIVICRPQDARLYLSEPRFGAFAETLAGQLSVLATFHGSGVLVADRFQAVTITGTGLTQPAGF